jgi:hypothetical protein
MGVLFRVCNAIPCSDWLASTRGSITLAGRLAVATGVSGWSVASRVVRSAAGAQSEAVIRAIRLLFSCRRGLVLVPEVEKEVRNAAMSTASNCRPASGVPCSRGCRATSRPRTSRCDGWRWRNRPRTSIAVVTTLVSPVGEGAIRDQGFHTLLSLVMPGRLPASGGWEGELWRGPTSSASGRCAPPCCALLRPLPSPPPAASGARGSSLRCPPPLRRVRSRVPPRRSTP